MNAKDIKHPKITNVILHSLSSTHKCNICVKNISRIEQIFDHLASDRHMREKVDLEKELKSSWNSLTTQRKIPSLLGNWIEDFKK
jgi:hypothetical protein